MAGNLEDPSQWRLSTVGGVKYKILKLNGSFEAVTAGLVLSVLVQGSDLIAFGEEMLPPPLTFGSLTIPQYTRFPGTNLIVKKLSVESFDDSLPTDPFGMDSSAPPSTYFKTVKVDIEFGPPPFGEANPADPTTFLEVSASASGEFIHTTGAGVHWISEADKSPTDSDDDESSASSQSGSAGGGGGGSVNRTPNVPCTVLCPQTQWDLKWRMIPFDYFQSTIRPRLNLMIGRVNSKPFSPAYADVPTTLLFTGHNYSYEFTWRNGYVNKPFISLNLKFLEKRILWQGSIRGHNDYWRPGVGWSGILINGRPPYERADFNALFAR